MFALSSASETSSNVIIEAMVVSLPVVTTRVGGILEVVVEPRNPASFAEAFIALLTNEARHRSIGKKNRETLTTGRSIQSMVRQTEQVLLDAFRQRSS